MVRGDRLHLAPQVAVDDAVEHLVGDGLLAGHRRVDQDVGVDVDSHVESVK